jgi:hypothetical protein
LYNNKFIKHPGKFKTHWLGPYEIAYVTDRRRYAVEDIEWRVEGRIGEWESAEVAL